MVVRKKRILHDGGFEKVGPITATFGQAITGWAMSGRSNGLEMVVVVRDRADIERAAKLMGLDPLDIQWSSVHEVIVGKKSKDGE